MVSDYRNLTPTFLHKFDVLILLAGHISVKMCAGPVETSLANNVHNFINIVRKLDKSQLLIYASSGSVYGSEKKIGNEDDILDFLPINSYDLTKCALDLHAKNFIKDGYQIVGFRFGTVNGWSPNTREELMINSMTRSGIEHGYISVSNKNISRPILGIADISRIIDAVIKNPIPGIFNVASFFATVGSISNSVSNALSSKILETPDLLSAYDFVMSTEKFTSSYNFEFQESIKSIIDELTNNETTFSNRNQFLEYV
jgi:nucleoside-diphosphate-sugar epimerase